VTYLVTCVDFIKSNDDSVFHVKLTARLIKLVKKLVLKESQYMYIKSTVPLNVFL